MASVGRSPRTLAVVAPVLLGQAMVALDASIVQVAGPVLQREMRLSDATLQLAVSLTVLVQAAALIAGARFGSRHGHARLFVAGAWLFTAAALACALALTPAMLLAARATQGLGAALLAAQVLSMLQTTIVSDRRSRALGAYPIVLAVAAVVGQVIGGLVVTVDPFGVGWRSAFAVDVVLGLAVLACSVGRLPGGAEAPGRRLDLRGAALLACAMLALVTPLIFGARAGWPWWSWLSLTTAAAAFLAFARQESRLAHTGSDPLVDLRLLARTGAAQGLAGTLVLMMCYGGLLFTIAVYLQGVLHRSALAAGLTFVAFSVGFAIGSLTCPSLPRPWHRGIAPGATLAGAVATACLAVATARQGWPPSATLLLAVAGASSGAAYGAHLQDAVHASAGHAATLSGVLATANQLGIVIGVAAFGCMYLSLKPAAASMSVVFAAVAVCLASAGTVDGWVRVRRR